MNIRFLEIPFDHPQQNGLRELRQEVLRKPLGMDLFAEDLSAERLHRHFALMQGPLALACLLAVPMAAGQVKLRQMAVRPGCQRQGLGRQLLGKVEQALLREEMRSFHLHARVSAAAFYCRQGYQETGEAFLEVGIPHVKMSKHLSSEQMT